MSKLPEYLASFCLAQESDFGAEVDAICALDQLCGQSLQYWEIVYVVGEYHRLGIQALAGKLATIKNLRIVIVRDATSYYRRRVIAASEAIGDVIVLTAFNEMSKADIIAFAKEAMADNRIVIGRNMESRWLFPTFHWILGLISRYRVDARDLKTIAVPRNRLVGILARPTAAIDLRFEPKRGIDPYVRRPVRLSNSVGEAGLKRRLELLVEIISTSAARFLAAYAFASLIVSIISACYGVYAVAVIFTLDNIQPGWFSTAIAQSGSVTFLALGLAVIALGIANIVDRMDGGPHDAIIDEIGNISFYERVHDLNVEITSRVHKVAE